MKTMQYNLKLQRGVASLLTAVVLLICITLVALFTSKTVVMETKMNADNFRTSQATAAAQAAMDRGMAYFSEGDMDHDDPPNGVDFTTPTLAQMPSAASCTIPNGTPASAETLSSGEQSTIAMFYFVNTRFYDANNDGTVVTTGTGAEINPCDCSAGNCLASSPTDKGMIVAKGWSDDCTAVRTITQCISVFDTLKEDPVTGGSGAPAPLLGKSSVQLNGTPNMINRFTQSNIWAGSGYTTNGGLETFLRPSNTNVSDYTLAQLLDEDPTHFAQPVSNGSSGNGIDVITNDNSLSKVNFTTFFSQSKAQVAAGAAAEGQRFSTIDAALAAPNQPLSGIVWIDATATNSGKMTGGQFGTPDKPVILVVDGDFDMGGNSGTKVYGMVYTTGSFNIGGGAVLVGSAIAESPNGPSGTGAGTPTVIYRPMGGSTTDKEGKTVGYNLSGFQKKGAVAGSWKDW